MALIQVCIWVNCYECLRINNHPFCQLLMNSCIHNFCAYKTPQMQNKNLTEADKEHWYNNKGGNIAK